MTSTIQLSAELILVNALYYKTPAALFELRENITGLDISDIQDDHLPEC